MTKTPKPFPCVAVGRPLTVAEMATKYGVSKKAVARIKKFVKGLDK